MQGTYIGKWHASDYDEECSENKLLDTLGITRAPIQYKDAILPV